MKFQEFLESFETLLSTSATVPLSPSSRFVILSDLHMGDGGVTDDLERNRGLVISALRDWYLERDYSLVLNGDIEELHKFGLKEIRRAWAPLYAVFDEFAARDGLWKIVGNHDLGLLREPEYPYPLHHGLKLEYAKHCLFAFHGHQASKFFVRHNYLSDFIVRYLAKPLRLKNTSISKDSHQRFKAERRIYRASKRLGIASLTGHTHRPLFESLSKYDSLRLSIEGALREYATADKERRLRLAELVGVYRAEFERLGKKEKKRKGSWGLYQEGGLLVPSVFNSGCATGKNGMTALELGGGEIRLVHWSGKAKARPYIEREALLKDTLEGTPYSRYVLAGDSLEYLFARIELLGPRPESYIAY